MLKDEYLSEAGKIPKQVAFVLEGVVRFCYYNNKGEEISDYFIDENHFATDYLNFEANMASSEYLQAATNCQVIVFPKQDWDELLNTIIGWDKIVTKIVKKCLLEKLKEEVLWCRKMQPHVIYHLLQNFRDWPIVFRFHISHPILALHNNP